MGFLVSQHGQLGAIPPSPFLSVSPLESMRSGGAIPPPPLKKRYLSDTRAIPYENKANGCDTPLCDTISKGYCAIWGGILYWAAKCGTNGRCTAVQIGGALRHFPLTQKVTCGVSQVLIRKVSKCAQQLREGGAFLLTVGAFLLTVELLCLQSLKALIRRTFPL